MSARVADCRHSPQCVSALTHTYLLAVGWPETPRAESILVSAFRRSEQRRNEYLNDLMTRGVNAVARKEKPVTTTPDSRIRTDFGMEGNIATDQFSTADIKLRPLRGAQPAQPIDTSTTAGRIAVMQAWDRGEDIEVMVRGGGPWRKAYGGVSNIPNGSWNWVDYDYRIAPPPAVPMDPYSRAKRYIDNSKRGVIEGVFCDLVDALDVAPVVMVNMECPSVDQPYPNIYQWISGFDLKPGRYRLLRDDE